MRKGSTLAKATVLGEGSRSSSPRRAPPGERRPAGATMLQQLIDALPVAALVTDNDRRYVGTNESASTLTGYNPDELRRLSVW